MTALLRQYSMLYCGVVSRMTVQIRDDLRPLLRSRAAAENISETQIINTALEQLLVQPKRGRWGTVSGPGDLSTRDEELLEGFGTAGG